MTVVTVVTRISRRPRDEEIPEAETTAVSWEEFQQMFGRAHRQGEHVAIVGQTGSGKSVLGLSLCKIIGRRIASDKRPTRVTVLVTKPRDDTVESLGWPVIKKWPPSYGQEHCIVWPRGGTPSTATERQRRVFKPLLDTIYHEGGQTVYIDEESDFEEPLPDGMALRGTMVQYWTKARGLKVTLISGTQRPRNVTRSMWSEPSWLFVFPPDDEDDLKRVAELSGAKDDVMRIAPQLAGHTFLCVRRQRKNEKQLYISRVD